MTAPEIMRAFDQWCQQSADSLPAPCTPEMWAGYADCYPLYIGHPLSCQWYVRERMPGPRVWRAEEDGGFTEMDIIEHGTENNRDESAATHALLLALARLVPARHRKAADAAVADWRNAADPYWIRAGAEHLVALAQSDNE